MRLAAKGVSALQGGTAGAPEELNNRNEEELRNYWPDMSQCQYYVGLQPQGVGPMPGISLKSDQTRSYYISTRQTRLIRC